MTRHPGAKGDLSGKVAIVTGSTRGLGRAVSARFVTEGASVVVNGRDAEACQSLVADLGEGAAAVDGDVGDAAVASQLVDTAVARFGRLDIVVNNAGVALDNFVTGATDERWAQTLATNLSGPFFVIRAAVPVMKAAGGGVIVNVTSWAGLRGNVGQVAYSAAKAGLYGLTLTCAKELGKFGIRVNALAPAVATDISADMSDRLTQEVARRQPLKIAGTPDDVAEAMLFLVSDRSRFITGQLLNVDGGLHLS